MPVSKVEATLQAAGKQAERMSASIAAARTPFGPSAVLIQCQLELKAVFPCVLTLIAGTFLDSNPAVPEKLAPASRAIYMQKLVKERGGAIDARWANLFFETQ
jgi:hypothetical protein